MLAGGVAALLEVLLGAAALHASDRTASAALTETNWRKLRREIGWSGVTPSI